MMAISVELTFYITAYIRYYAAEKRPRLYLLCIVCKRRTLGRLERMQMTVENVEAEIAHFRSDD